MSTVSSGLGVSWHEVPAFRISKVWSAVRKIYSQHFALFLAITLVETAVISAPAWLAVNTLSGFGRPLRVSLLVLAMLWIFIAGALGQALVALIVFQRFRHQPEATNANLRRIASRALPLILTVLGVIGIALVGLLALVIPCLIAVTVYSAAVPACAVEGLSPGASLTRSADLTRSHRWRIFGLAIEFGIISGALNKIVELAWVGPLGQSATSSYLTVVNQIVGVVPTSFFMVAFAIVYCQLRAIKEGDYALR